MEQKTDAVKLVGWINILRRPDGTRDTNGVIYPSLEYAKMCRDNNYVKYVTTVRVEWEE